MDSMTWCVVIALAWAAWFIVMFGDDLVGTWIGRLWDALKVAVIPTRSRR